jgi:hypothetical protein
VRDLHGRGLSARGLVDDDIVAGIASSIPAIRR